VQSWARESARSFGLSQGAAIDAATGFGNMLTQLGYTGDAALEASTGTVQLAADLGSFNNLETGDVLDRISAAMRGEYDSLQLLIPNINAARVENEALAMTGKDSKDALTAQEKATATLAIIQRDGAAAAGDFAETSGGLANQTKIAAAQFEDFKATLGQSFLPAATGAMSFLNDTAIPALGGLFDVTQDVVGVFADLPGPVQVGAAALGLWAVAGDRVMGGLGSINGSLSPAKDGFRAFGEALDYARAKGDGMFTVLRSVGGYAGGELLRGLGGLARAIGPELGIAAAVTAVGFMVDGLTSMDEATDEAKAAQQSLADALRETNGVIDENIRQTAAKAAQDSGLLDTADSLGIKLSLVTDAVLGNAGAYDQVIAASEAYLQQQLALAGGDPTDASFTNSADAVRVFRNNLGELVPTVQQTASDQRQLSAATDQAAGSAQAAVDPTAAFKAELDAAAAAADNAKKETDEFKLALDLLTGAHVSAIQVEAAYQEALDAAKGAVEGLDGAVVNETGSLDLNSEAGRKASAVLLDVRDSGNDLIATLQTQGATEDVVRAKDAELRGSFIETARQMGFTGADAETLADQILGIPAERETRIIANTRQAYEELRKFLQTEYKINVGVTYGQARGGAAAAPGRTGLADGGLVVGPGTGRSDSILGLDAEAGVPTAWVSNGEFVINQRATRKHRALVEAINADRLAEGGMVGPVVTAGLRFSDFADYLASAGAQRAASAAVAGVVGSGVLGGTWHSIWNFVKAAIPQARINSTFRSGDPGYHGRNKAIDFGFGTGPGGMGSAGLASINRLLHDGVGRNLAELIYDGIGDDRPDLKNGRPLTYNAGTRAAHRNHVHAAVYDDGGWLEPGYTLAFNGTGERERIRTAEQEAALRGRAGALVHIENQYVRDAVDMDLVMQQASFRERMGSFT
jgi:hypothetical protein